MDRYTGQRKVIQKLTESLQGPASPGQSVACGEPSGSTGLETMVFSPLVSAQVGGTGPAAPRGQGRAQGILGLWGTRALGAGDSGIVGDQSSGCRGFWNCGGSGKPPVAFQSLQGCPDTRDLCLNVLPSRSLSRCLWVTLSLAACLFSL